MKIAVFCASFGNPLFTEKSASFGKESAKLRFAIQMPSDREKEMENCENMA
jgi:hypothetical protein